MAHQVLVDIRADLEGQSNIRERPQCKDHHFPWIFCRSSGNELCCIETVLLALQHTMLEKSGFLKVDAVSHGQAKNDHHICDAEQLSTLRAQQDPKLCHGSHLHKLLVCVAKSLASMHKVCNFLLGDPCYLGPRALCHRDLLCTSSRSQKTITCWMGAKCYLSCISPAAAVPASRG